MLHNIQIENVCSCVLKGILLRLVPFPETSHIYLYFLIMYFFSLSVVLPSTKLSFVLYVYYLIYAILPVLFFYLSLLCVNAIVFYGIMLLSGCNRE